MQILHWGDFSYGINKIPININLLPFITFKMLVGLLDVNLNNVSSLILIMPFLLSTFYIKKNRFAQ